MGRVESAAQLGVVVAYSPAPDQVDQVSLTLSIGATVSDALDASGLLARHPDIDLATQSVGVWGKLRSLDEALRDGDRVEIYRPLKVDPKEARRQRYRRHREAVGEKAKR